MFNLSLKLQKILTCFNLTLIFVTKRYKIMYKKILKPSILSAILGITLTLFLGNSSGPGGNRTGAPGSAGSCSGCHYSSVLDGSITVELIDPNTSEIVSESYIPNKTYKIKVTMVGNSSKMGFQVTSLDGSNAQAGTITDAPAKTSVYTASSAEIWGHTSPGTNQNSNSWEATFTAPSAGTGTITFYGAGVVANGNGNNSGDEVVTNSFSFDESTTNSKTTISNNVNKVWINHKTGKLVSNTEIAEIAIWNNQGQLISKRNHINDINLERYPRGIYYVNFLDNSGKWNSNALKW